MGDNEDCFISHQQIGNDIQDRLRLARPWRTLDNADLMSQSGLHSFFLACIAPEGIIYPGRAAIDRQLPLVTKILSQWDIVAFDIYTII